MNHFSSIYNSVYKKGNLFNLDKKIKSNPFIAQGKRKNSVIVAGGALGDEGKGRITDELTADFLSKYDHVVHYRDNGGANAGHTVQVGKIKIALHQLGAGVLQKGCTVIIGKEMVVHPEDLVLEIEEVLKAINKKTLPAKLMIDEMALLCLDTHRAFENGLKTHSTGSKGSTGRGIAPAYADVVFRNPLRMRDLLSSNWDEKIATHYNLYNDWLKGMSLKLSQMEVPRLDGSLLKVGSLSQMNARLEKARKILLPFITPLYDYMSDVWQSKTPIVFEKAQALGLDKRWGVYPDVTASDCTFDGIFSSTEGIADPNLVAVKAATIKATYSSSVGSRVLPTMMEEKLASKIREDANEYGATTKRPRDIAHIDLPMLSFLFKTNRVEYLVMTHLDISYLNEPIKVCVDYQIDGKSVSYRPDQEYLNQVEPVYVELPAWDGEKLHQIKAIKKLPKTALQYVTFISKSLNVKLLMATTGPAREQTIKWY